MEPQLIIARAIEYLDTGKYIKVYSTSPVLTHVYVKTPSNLVAAYTAITMPYEEAVSPISVDSLLLLLSTFGKHHIESLYPSMQIKEVNEANLKHIMRFLNAIGTYAYIEGETAFIPKTELYLYD